MKNKSLTLWIVIFVLAAGAIYYFSISKKSNSTYNNVTDVTTTTSTNQSNNYTSATNLKEFDINNQYSIMVPSDFSIKQIPYSITNVPNYSFQEPNYKNLFSVMVNPYLSSNTPIDGKCAISLDSTKVYCEGMTLNQVFKISGNQKVFYGTNSGDLTLDCTMNSKCPPPPPSQRYSITYVFVIPNQADNTLVEFWAGDAVRKPNPQVSDFEGSALLLHDTVIPSFSPLGQN